MASSPNDETDLKNIVFFPPLYQQRYIRVSEIIAKLNPKECLQKVVDIGCAELSFFRYLKEMDIIDEVILLDMDLQLLKYHFRKVAPLAYDYVMLRKNPLTVSVVCGDATFLHPCLFNADVVTMIEFIEHLPVSELPSIVHNVFGIIQPGLVIITTPNADYNKHFPGLKSGHFRHHDHKFEWTEKEFRKWCREIVKRYVNFDVDFTGCGEDKEGIFCSQIGIFQKEKQSLNKVNSSHQSKKYCPSEVESPCDGCMLPWKELKNCKILFSIDYPFDNRSKEQICIDYIRASLFDLCSWLRRSLDSSDLEFPFQVDYNHPHSYQDSHKQSHTADQCSKENECLNPTRSATFELLESLHIEEESFKLNSNKFMSNEITNKNIEISRATPRNDTRSLKIFNTNLQCGSTKEGYVNIPHDSYKLSMQSKNVSTDNKEFDCDVSLFSRDKSKSKTFDFVALDTGFQISTSYNILKSQCCKFFYIEYEQLVCFTLTTFCLWSNLLASEGLVLETLGKEKFVTLSGTDEKIIQLSLDQNEDSSS